MVSSAPRNIKEQFPTPTKDKDLYYNNPTTNRNNQIYDF